MNVLPAALAAAVLISACTTGIAPRRTPPAYPAPPPVEVRESSVQRPSSGELDSVLAYYDRVLALKGGELSREYERTRQSYERDGSDVHRMQLAILLSMPNAGFRDDAAAIGLLQPLVKDRPDESSLRPLALLVQNYILELRRSEDALQAQSSKLRDEQRRAEALQQKLEALLQMEMKMIEREQAAQPKKR